MTHRVVIVSGFPLTSTPRVVKEATVLADAGYDVEVLASILDPSNTERELALGQGKKWRTTYVIDNRKGCRMPQWRWQMLRLRRRLWTEAWTRFEIGNVRQLSYFGPELLRTCLRRHADLYSVHLEPALWVGVQLLRRGRRVGVDFEDWYSEDLAVADRLKRPIELLKRWESTLLKEGSYAWTTSQSLSSALASAYEGKPPKVVMNTFPWSEREHLDHQLNDRKDRKKLSICWFSQTIGPDRGLEDLARATHLLPAEIEIHLRGKSSSQYQQHLLGLTHPTFRHSIHFHPQVSHRDLISRIAEHDVGFAGETAHCPSRDLTITNKVFQYFLAGIPVVASDTAGQREVQQHAPAAIRLYRSGSPEELARTIRIFLDPEVRRAAANQSLNVAREQYNWEHSAEIIKNSVAEAVDTPVLTAMRKARLH